MKTSNEERTDRHDKRSLAGYTEAERLAMFWNKQFKENKKAECAVSRRKSSRDRFHHSRRSRSRSAERSQSRQRQDNDINRKEAEKPKDVAKDVDEFGREIRKEVQRSERKRERSSSRERRNPRDRLAPSSKDRLKDTSRSRSRSRRHTTHRSKEKDDVWKHDRFDGE